MGQQIDAFTAKPAFRRQRSLRDQIERAAVSISNNIAEGFERGTTQELLTFLYIASGSAGEVRSMLCLLEGIPQLAGTAVAGGEREGSSSEAAPVSDLKSEISNLKSQAESISRQLRGWADSLQSSGIKGQRYLNERARRRDKVARDRQELLRQLDEIRRTGAPQRTGS